MGKLAVLLLLAAPVLAQDDAAALFYKGFWLEQAEGKLDEAAALYGKLLSEKPDAPEAPRALLGLIRIKVAKNEDPKELVAELERRYPGAKEEIAGAKRMAVRDAFDALPGPGDSPVTLKLKALYEQLSNPPWIMSDPDRFFLVDLGTAAHPMLAQLLRASNSVTVAAAAGVLVEQRTPEAYALLAGALLDDSGLFRSTIVEMLRGRGGVPRSVIEALGKLYDRASPRLRAEIVETLVTLAAGEGRDRAFDVVTRALASDDKSVRGWALALVGSADVPDAYVDAVVAGVEGGRLDLSDQLAPYLLFFADRASFRDRIERVLQDRKLDANYLPEIPEEGAMLLARILLRDHAKGRGQRSVLVKRAAAASPRAAVMLLMAALETGDEDLAKNASIGGDEPFRRRYLGEEADKLRAAAVAAAGGPGEADNQASYLILNVVGVTAADLPSIIEGLRRRGKRGFPSVLWERLAALGPANAGALVEFCRDGRQAADLLASGSAFAKRDDSGVEFFARVIPEVGFEAGSLLRGLAGKPALAPLVADRLLAATGPEWKWSAPYGRTHAIFQTSAGQEYPGPKAWFGINEGLLVAEPLRKKLLGYVQDPRREIRAAAVNAAAAEESDAGTAALKLVLASSVAGERGAALNALATRVPDALALVREFLKRADLSEEDRSTVAGVIWAAKTPAMTGLAHELLLQGAAWDLLWPTYYQLAPKEAVDLAIASPPTDESLGILANVDDPRRIEVFRAVLKGTDRKAIRAVLLAVRDQYLVELGEEALLQLRNPEADIRQIASEAIDKLKFYAEAKKAFEK